MPAENLISPEAVRQAMWRNPEPDDGLAFIKEKLRGAGARNWQISLVAQSLVRPLHEVEPLPAPVETAAEAPLGESTSEPTSD
jgi:hypothetical protein